MDGLFPSCSCKDFELRNQPRKHILAVRLFIEQQKAGAQPQAAVPQEPPPKVKRPTYKQG